MKQEQKLDPKDVAITQLQQKVIALEQMVSDGMQRELRLRTIVNMLAPKPSEQAPRSIKLDDKDPEFKVDVKLTKDKKKVNRRK